MSVLSDTYLQYIPEYSSQLPSVQGTAYSRRNLNDGRWIAAELPYQSWTTVQEIDLQSHRNFILSQKMQEYISKESQKIEKDKQKFIVSSTFNLVRRKPEYTTRTIPLDFTKEDYMKLRLAENAYRFIYNQTIAAIQQAIQDGVRVEHGKLEKNITTSANIAPENKWLIDDLPSVLRQKAVKEAYDAYLSNRRKQIGNPDHQFKLFFKSFDKFYGLISFTSQSWRQGGLCRTIFLPGPIKSTKGEYIESIDIDTSLIREGKRWKLIYRKDLNKRQDSLTKYIGYKEFFFIDIQRNKDTPLGYSLIELIWISKIWKLEERSDDDRIMVHLPPIKSIIHGDAKDTAFIRFTALSAKRITFSKFEQVVIRQRVQISISQSETISILLVYLYSQDNIQHALLIKGKKGVWTERCDRILDGRGKAIPLTPKRRSTFYHLYNIWEKEQNESVSIFARRYILEEEVSQISSTLKRITALQHLEKVKILEKENSSLLINKRIDFLYKNLVIIGIESQCNTPARYTLNDLELGIEEDIRIAEAPRQNIQSEQRQEFLASIIDPDLIPENGDDEQEEEVEILSEENQYSSAFIGIAPEAPSISQTTLLGIQTQADISRIHSEVVVRPALQRLEEIRSLEDLEVVEEETPIDPDLSTTSSMVAQLIDSLLQNRSRQQSIYSFFHQQAPDLIIPTSSGSDSISNYRPELTPLQLDATALVQSIYPQTQIPPTTQEDIVIPLPEEIGVFIEDAENQSFEEVQIRICAIDPGIRTFATIIDPIRCKGFRWGEQDFQRLVIIRKKISRIQSELSMPLKNSKKRAKQEVIFRLWQKHNNLVRDLHIRLSKWLNENYDVVFLPKLDVARMVRKKGRFNPPPPPRITTVPTQAEQIAEIQRRREERKKGRKINKQTAASMHALAHSKFYNRLQETMGFLPTITEEFTSQGCSSCGTRKTNLGSAKVYNCPNPLCQLRADRDLNGAKNILQKIIIEVEKLGTVPS